jgi:hypothetical protein
MLDRVAEIGLGEGFLNNLGNRRLVKGGDRRNSGHLESLFEFFDESCYGPLCHLEISSYVKS